MVQEQVENIQYQIRESVLILGVQMFSEMLPILMSKPMFKLLLEDFQHSSLTLTLF